MVPGPGLSVDSYLLGRVMITSLVTLVAFVLYSAICDAVDTAMGGK